MRFGYNDDWPTYRWSAVYGQYGGADTARFPINWSALQPYGPGSVDAAYQTTLDQTMYLLSYYGQRPIMEVSAAPWWAGGSQTAVLCHPSTYDQVWEDILVYLLNRYGGYQPCALEIWNEPNISVFGNVSSARLAQLIARGRNALNRAGLSSSVKLVSGGVFCAQAGWDTYLYDVKTRTVGLDCQLGIHPYAFDSDPNTAINRCGVLYSTGRLISLLTGDIRDLWVTEWGFSSHKTGWSESAQSTALSLTYDAFTAPYLGYSGAAAALCHRLFWAQQGTQFEGYSTLRQDATAKPSYNMFRAKRGL